MLAMVLTLLKSSSQKKQEAIWEIGYTKLDIKRTLKMKTNHFLVPSGDKDELLYAWAEAVAHVLLNHSSGPSRSIFVHDCESATKNIRQMFRTNRFSMYPYIAYSNASLRNAKCSEPKERNSWKVSQIKHKKGPNKILKSHTLAHAQINSHWISQL